MGNKFFKKKQTRYFYFSTEAENHEVSCYVEGEDVLLSLMAGFTNNYGFGMEFKVQEISKADFEELTKDDN